MIERHPEKRPFVDRLINENKRKAAHQRERDGLQICVIPQSKDAHQRQDAKLYQCGPVHVVQHRLVQVTAGDLDGFIDDQENSKNGCQQAQRAFGDPVKVNSDLFPPLLRDLPDPPP